MRLRVCLPLGFLLACSLCLAQGGQGGGGFGGSFGGGIQGGQGGEFAGDGDQVRQNLFLTPGDRTEWEIEMEPGEGVLVLISSQVFDPAVAVQDEQGKELAENDDIKPGDQRARLIFIAPAKGKYKVVITNYKNAAGGQFELNATRFRSVAIEPGKQKKISVKNERAWARFRVEKPQDFSLIFAQDRGQGRLAVLGPGGEAVPALEPLQSDRTLYRFTAAEPGEHFIRFGELGPQITVQPIEVRPLNPGQNRSVSLARGQVIDYQVKAAKGQLIRIGLPTDQPKFLAEIKTDETDQNGQNYTVLSSPGIRNETTILSHKQRELRFSLHSIEAQPQQVALRLEQAGSPLGAANGETGRLDWHQTRFYTFEGKAGDVVNVQGSASGYELELAVFGPGGHRTAVPRVDAKGTVGTTLPITVGGRYTVLVRGGGIGPFSIKSDPLPPKQIQIGMNEGAITGQLPQVWRTSLNEDDDMAFRIESSGLHWQIQVIGPSGQTVGRLNTRDGKSGDFLRLKASRAGSYTFLIRAAKSGAATGTYRFKWIDLNG